MKRKYLYSTSLNRNEFEMIINNRGREQHFYIKINKRNLLIRNPKYLFGIMPVNFQVSFVGKYKKSDEGTVIEGGFDVPVISYRICTIAFIVLAGVFLVFSDKSAILYLIPMLVFMSITGYILIKLYAWISTLLFCRQNEMVLALLDSIVLEFPLYK